MTTKDIILYESLKLFSENGFDAVSTRMIARAVGLSDSVIYKHFKNKKEILDTIVEICKERFITKRMSVDIFHMCWDEVEAICLDMFHFQTQDEWIVMFRRLLMIEQFKNEEMAKLFKGIFIDSVVNSMTYMFKVLIDEGYMKPGNPKVYAMEFYAPFFMYYTVSEQLEELEQCFKEHIADFRKYVRTPKCDE